MVSLLRSLLFTLIEVRSLEEYEGTEWEAQEDQVGYDALAGRASSTGEVVFGTFYAYDSADDE